jgi:transposase
VNVLRLNRKFPARELKRLMGKIPDKRSAERLRAIALCAKGKRPAEIASILGRHVETIRKWIKLYNEGGAERLTYRHTGGRTGKLSDEQEGMLVVWLKEGRPDSRRWTLGALSERLLQDFGVQISEQQVSARIIRLGMNHLIYRPRRKQPTRKRH